MTRKDYELIADVIHQRLNIARGFPNFEHRQSAVEILIDLMDDFSIVLEKDNPRFNRRIFLEACGCGFK